VSGTNYFSDLRYADHSGKVCDRSLDGEEYLTTTVTRFWSSISSPARYGGRRALPDAFLFGMSKHGTWAKITLIEGVSNLIPHHLVRPFGIIGDAFGTADSARVQHTSYIPSAAPIVLRMEKNDVVLTTLEAVLCVPKASPIIPNGRTKMMLSIRLETPSMRVILAHVPCFDMPNRTRPEALCDHHSVQAMIMMTRTG